MDNEVKKIIDKYKYDSKIRKYSKKYFFQNHSIYANIRCRKDINSKLNNVEIKIQIYNEVDLLVNDDIIELEKALGEYQIAISKVLTCYGYEKLDFDYSAEELQNLINNIYKLEEEIEHIRMRKMCQ
ncbi:hypothetical protein [Clostridium botulinum]|uniref:hypothetical protein n=1 Tax=Clostridium botulinum TaxID=1491 RepID=UPI000957B022|nr:hypothetical protein [Clostridium botulinum]APU60767.1 hypothetical protein NPD8_2726 [Clostridium botulinum]